MEFQNSSRNENEFKLPDGVIIQDEFGPSEIDKFRINVYQHDKDPFESFYRSVLRG